MAKGRARVSPGASCPGSPLPGPEDRKDQASGGRRASSSGSRNNARVLPCSRRLLKDGFVGLARRCCKLAVEVGIEWAKGELAAIGILKPELAIPDDAGAV